MKTTLLTLAIAATSMFAAQNPPATPVKPTTQSTPAVASKKPVKKIKHSSVKKTTTPAATTNAKPAESK